MREYMVRGKERDTKERNFIKLFQEKVKTYPNKVALKFRENEYTYEELNKYTNKLAHYLVKLGVKCETLVGVYMERTDKMVVALMSILKAGGAYVPLDPSHPTERNNYILKESGIKYIITEEHLKGDIGENIKKLCFEELVEQLASESDENINALDSNNQLAYVIFTSGSTGRPKGVAIQHEGMTNYLLCMRDNLDLVGDEIGLAVVTITFDISISELFVPLISGAKLIVADSQTVKDGVKLLQLIEREHINLIQVTPSTMYMLLDAGWEDATDMKIVIGGEAWNIQLAREILGRNCKGLWNLYGPTETTIYSTIAPIHPEDEIIPLGKPLDQTILYVLDENMEPVPVGEEGELFIGGIGVARGYLNNEELTNERFIESPFDKAEGRLYRTGDVVKFIDKDTLLYVGRQDFQVKVRGFRIELGEIEKAINKQSGVSQGVVVAINNGRDAKLCAYIKIKPETGVTTLEIRQGIEELLPPYMVPNMITLVDEFPMTPNGKVDRKALMNLEVEV